MAKSKKIDKDMGFRLKKARLDQKLTYDELSEMSGVSSRYIKEIENHGNIPSLLRLPHLIHNCFHFCHFLSINIPGAANSLLNLIQISTDFSKCFIVLS